MDAKQTGSTTARAPQIRSWAVERLAPYARNARKHPEEQIAGIVRSIQAFGLVGAIIVRDGVIGKGHGTFEAVRRLYEVGEAVYPAPGKEDGAKPYKLGTVPVLDVSGWSEAKFRAYVIADNRLAEDAGWDRDLLRLELQDLKEIGFDVGLTGFAPDELDIAMKAAAISPGGGVHLVEVADLADRFWISLRGPLKQQAKVLQALRNATKDLEGVEVELGTINQPF